MTQHLDTMRWRKSSYSSGQNGECVELANIGAVRDSKNPDGQVLRADLGVLLAAVKTGRLELAGATADLTRSRRA